MAAAEFTHSPTPEDIMEYLDGEGTPERRLAIEAHLASCVTCEVVAAGQRRLSAAAATWQVEPAPGSLHTPPAPPARPLWGRILDLGPSRVTLISLGTAAAVLLAVAMWQQGPDRRMSVQLGGRTAGAQAFGGRAAEAPPVAGVSAVDNAIDRAQASIPPPAPAPNRLDRSVRIGDGDRSAFDSTMASRAQGVAMPDSAPRPSSIIRTATLRIVTKEFDGVRASVEGMVAAASGFIDEMTVTGNAGAARALHGTLRIPSDRLASVTDRLRQLGQVTEDTQGAEEVSDQLVDIGARLASAKTTEQRLTELLRNRTGKLSDVLEVERELARVRVDIERLDAQSTNLGRRVSYATVTIQVDEERKAGLTPGPLSLVSRVRVAAADGFEAALQGVVSMLLTLLVLGPSLLVWGLVIGAGWLIVRRVLRSRAAGSL